MTTDRAAHLATIRDRPDDDGPRLVYADWLEQCGECERAEFIRVQIELARLIGDGSRCPVCDWPCRDDGCQPDNCAFRPSGHTKEYRRWKARQTTFHELRRREQELLKLHWRSWAGDVLLGIWNDHILAERTLHGRRDIPEQAFHFTRGFIDSLTCSWADWGGWPCRRPHDIEFSTRPCPDCGDTGRVPGHADAILREHPVKKVRLTTWPETEIVDHGQRFNSLRIRSHKTIYPVTGQPDRVLSDVQIMTNLLGHSWPGLEFELPPEMGPSPLRAAYRTYAEFLEHARERLTLPPYNLTLEHLRGLTSRQVRELVGLEEPDPEDAIVV